MNFRREMRTMSREVRYHKFHSFFLILRPLISAGPRGGSVGFLFTLLCCPNRAEPTPTIRRSLVVSFDWPDERGEELLLRVLAAPFPCQLSRTFIPFPPPPPSLLLFLQPNPIISAHFVCCWPFTVQQHNPIYSSVAKFSFSLHSKMEKVIQNCAQKFGVELALDVCLQMFGELFQLNSLLMPGNDGNEGNGTEIGRCDDNEEQRTAAPSVAHNLDHFSGPCTALELWTLRFVFPFLQLLCLGGNLVNLLVYNLPYFGHNSSVYLLRAKAVANLFFVQCRLLEVLHAWLPLQSHLEWLYWHSRPWMITVGNLNGTLSTWMTMLISLQTMLCVLRPFSFRHWCGRRPTLCCLIGSVLCAAGIHSLFLITHEVVSVPTLQFDSSAQLSAVPSFVCFRIATTFRMRLSNALWATALERPYYWVQMSATILLPTLVMMVCTVLVVSRFTIKVGQEWPEIGFIFSRPQLGQSFSQRRKCVIRLTVATTVSHLLLEGPAALGYALFALRGAAMPNQREWMCALTASNNALSALNATIPFFLFLLCSAQFRRMSVLCLQSCISMNGSAMKIPPDDGPSQCAAGTHRRPSPSHKEKGMVSEQNNRTRQFSFGGFPVVEEEEEEEERDTQTRKGGRDSISETTTALLPAAGGGAADTLL